MAIDWEVEYNNRARVPEHPQIFERWTRDGAAYRDEASKEGRAEIGLKYGPSPRQTIDVFKPRGGTDGPLALFIHGGYWRSLEPSSFSQMARGMNAHGVTVAVSGYDLAPQVSIGQIVEQTQQACLFSGSDSRSASWSAAIRPADISPPAWSRPTGRRSMPARRPTSRRWAMRSQGCTTSRRCFISPPTRTSSSMPPRRGGFRRCSGRCPRGACSMPWSAATNPRSSSGTAKSSPRAGARRASRRAMRRCPA